MTKNNQIVRAVRATIHLGEKLVEVFQMPDGHYELSQSSSTKAVGKNEYSRLAIQAVKIAIRLNLQGFETRQSLG